MIFTGTRTENWPIRLTDYVRQTFRDPCVVGENDCVVWSLRAVDVMCETAIAEEVRGKFHNDESVAGYMAEREWADLHDACEDYFGQPLEAGAYGQQGDIVVIPVSPRYPIGAMSVLVGQHIMSPGPQGLIRIMFTAALMMGASVYKTGR